MKKPTFMSELNSARYNEDGALTVSHPLLTYSDSLSLLVSELFIANDALSNAEVCGATEFLQAHIELRLQIGSDFSGVQDCPISGYRISVLQPNIYFQARVTP